MRKVVLSVLGACALAWGLALMGTPAGASTGCGNGAVDSNEECDSGGALFIDGDPDKGACTTGSRCYFQFTCCKFNCQYVGTPGVPCQDGDNCTGPDTCDQVGVCQGGPPSVNGTPCDDGLFCDGAEGCENGVCVSGGNPCPATACNQCQEDSDSCFDPAGSPCSDGSVCVDGGNCDGAGLCVGGTFNSGPCDDGLFCNGTDTCNGGACSVHSGDPCPVGDGDGNCSEECNEDTDTCDANDPTGSPCDDGLFCNGTSDVCDAGVCSGSGTTACDDGNPCTTDACDEGTDACTGTPLPDAAGCDDGDPCTLGDVCTNGVCAGTASVLDDFCPWTLLLRENPKKDLLRTYFQTSVAGDVCGGTIRMFGQTEVTSDLVSDEADGDSQLQLAVDVNVLDDVVSAGAGAMANPTLSFLPMLDTQEVELPGGSLASKNNGGVYDLTGTHPLAAKCHAARTSYPTHTAEIDALPATGTASPVRLGPYDVATIAASHPGALNVIDVDGSITVGGGGELALDGGGDPNTVLVLRVSGRFKLLVLGTLSLNNGLTPDHVLIRVKGKKCLLNTLSIGGGTLLCSPGRIVARFGVAWVGAIFGDGKMLSTGEKSSFTYSPFRGF